MNNDIVKYEPFWGEWYIEELLGKDINSEVYKIYKSTNGKKEYATLKYISISQVAVGNIKMYTDEEIKAIYEDKMNMLVNTIKQFMNLQDCESIVRYKEFFKKQKAEENGYDIFIRMELLTPLKDCLKEKPLLKKDVVELGINIAETIRSCSEKRFFHREITFDNIFVDEKGRFKLCGFGSRDEWVVTGRAMPVEWDWYEAPEVLKHERYGANVDIYSLGILMYMLLNNKRIPFLNPEGSITSDDVDMALRLRASGTENMKPPKYADDRLSDIILRACCYDRKIRYTDANEFIADLTEYAENATDLDKVVLPMEKSPNKEIRIPGDIYIPDQPIAPPELLSRRTDNPIRTLLKRIFQRQG